MSDMRYMVDRLIERFQIIVEIVKKSFILFFLFLFDEARKVGRLIQLIISANKVRAVHTCVVFGSDLVQKHILLFSFAFDERLSFFSFYLRFLFLFIFEEGRFDISVGLFTIVDGCG